MAAGEPHRALSGAVDPTTAMRTIARMREEPTRSEPNAAAAAIAAAERLGDLADTAELMGDDANAARLREQASVLRDVALHELDHRSSPTASD